MSLTGHCTNGTEYSREWPQFYGGERNTWTDFTIIPFRGYFLSNVFFYTSISLLVLNTLYEEIQGKEKITWNKVGLK